MGAAAHCLPCLVPNLLLLGHKNLYEVAPPVHEQAQRFVEIAGLYTAADLPAIKFGCLLPTSALSLLAPPINSRCVSLHIIAIV